MINKYIIKILLLFRISYCSADATHDHVFAFIATNYNETMECHAFLCPKRKTARIVALTVAQAFDTAYEAWKISQIQCRGAKSEKKGDKDGKYLQHLISSK